MTLDFDVDDGPSFQDLVLSGRRDVLKGRAMAQCWSDLADQHPFFKDIAKEGRLRGETMGEVLAAVERLSRVIQRTESDTAAQAAATEASAPSPPVAGNADENEFTNAQVLVRVADAYLHLYSTTPVPTRAQWLASVGAAAVTETAGTLDAASVDASASTACVAGPSSSPVAATSSFASQVSSCSTVGRYLGKLRATLLFVAAAATTACDGDESDGNDASNGAGADGEDGSFAEEELRELMRCCAAAGRRAARHASLSKAEARAVREMVKALQNFVGSSTLEW